MGTDKDDSTDGSDIDPFPTLDTVLELLANRRRRFALYTLVNASDRIVTFEALIEDVATLEAAREDVPFTRDRYLDVASGLYHWHLPVLSDLGIVDCDARSGVVRYRPYDSLETWTDRVRCDELSG